MEMQERDRPCFSLLYLLMFITLSLFPLDFLLAQVHQLHQPTTTAQNGLPDEETEASCHNLHLIGIFSRGDYM